jgi:uncharacterized protein YidB (DUF937 family)
MGILDSVMQSAEKHPEVSQEQHSGLVSAAMQMFGSNAGLSSLINNAQSHGLGGVVQSWIGSGSNQGIAPQQVQQLLGPDRVQELAGRVGIPPGIASAALARVLPALVDRLTPEGRLPQAA